ncbi:MAG TPA: SGNH/GDSL hydrolase family protein [Agriterribacter sp.]|nr:SGNH/GDSL hydrolase family protein [Agriterribacter sp.]
MKRLILILLLLPILSNAQFKIAYLGDSFCDGCCGVPDSLRWRAIVTDFFKTYYDTVEEIKLCEGGEDVSDAMPDWHAKHIAGRNIDSALRSGADLIVIQYSGNHFMRNYEMDSVKYWYKYIGDTLLSLNKPFLFVSNLQRQNTVGGGNTYLTFLEEVREINKWLDSSYHYQYVNVFDTMFNQATNKPVAAYLYADSIHLNSTGYAAFSGAVIRNSLTLDSAAGFSSPVFYNTSLQQEGDSVIISTAVTKAKRIVISTSDEGVHFVDWVDSFYEQNKKWAVPLAAYVRLRLIRDKAITITKKFIM